MAQYGIKVRAFEFCPGTPNYPNMNKLIETCLDCDRFFAGCCSGKGNSVCHHWRVYFADGACPGNGTANAVSGIGVACGVLPSHKWAVPDPAAQLGLPLPPGGYATNQTAELMAAIWAAEHVYKVWLEDKNSEFRQPRERGGPRRALIIGTDSEYVTRGITEWYPSWRVRGWTTALGRTPANLEYFHRLNAAVTQLEGIGIPVGFLHVPRECNAIADGLAKRAAEAARQL